MYIKIYFNNKPLFLTDTITAELDSYKHQEGTVYFDDLSSAFINSVIHEMSSTAVKAGVYYHTDFGALKEAFTRKFKVIQTGGGLVRNDAGEYLMMFRRNKWDLPKGKLDEGETIEECAIREITEETGLQNLTLEKHLINTYHTYEEGGKMILKENCWFLVAAAGEQHPQPQVEEDITEIQWVRPGKFEPFTANSMPSILDVLKAGGLI